MKRLSAFLRGPLFLLVVLGICVGATHLAHRTLASAGGIRISITSQHTAVDPTTGLKVRVQQAEVSDLSGGAENIRLNIQIDLRGTIRPAPSQGFGVTEPKLPTGFDELLAVLPDGSSYFGIVSRAVLAPSNPPAVSGEISVTVGFRIPSHPRHLVIVWSDGGRIVPPPELATLRIETGR